MAREPQEAQELTLPEMLRLHRVSVDVAGTRMPWSQDWPLDRLMVEAADTIERLSTDAHQLREALRTYGQHTIGCNALRCMKCGCSVEPSNQHLVWIGGEKRLEHDIVRGDCTCGFDQVLASTPEDKNG